MLNEASGITASRRVQGRLWAVNDSGQPVIYALDASGAVSGQVRLMGATDEDWEAIAVGPCPSGSCVYIGDIGDNNATRTNISVYRLPEPAEPQSTAAPDTIHATYPDGAHDAEALVITPDGTLYVITKGEKERVRVIPFSARRAAGRVGAAGTRRHITGLARDQAS